MDIQTRIKALTRLAKSQSQGAVAALQNELDQVAAALRSEQDYDALSHALAILDVIGHRFSARAVDILDSFLDQVERREILYSDQRQAWGSRYAKYHSAQRLTGDAIEVLAGLRYFETRSVLRILLRFSIHASDEIRKKSIDALAGLADYNIDVFYGPDRKGGLGAEPQKEVILALEQLASSDLRRFFSGALTLLRGLLSPVMEASSWSYRAVTLERGAIPAWQEISDVRLRSVLLLKRLYLSAETVPDRLAILSALQEATRMPDVGGDDQTFRDIIVRDAAEVISFYKELVATEDLQIVQSIESRGYWIYFHARAVETRELALSLETEISAHPEYQVYRVLVGYEGIFGSWRDRAAASERDFEATEQMRRRAASEFAASISEESYPKWRTRIVTFARTESNDLATFPIFYAFLEELARLHPLLALKLVTEDHRSIERFLIPILRGLWAGPEQLAARSLILSWIDDPSGERGQYLFACTKLFLSNDGLDIGLVRHLLERAVELKDLAAIRQVVSVAITNYRSGDTILLNELFLPALSALTREGDASWVFDAWFRQELNSSIAALDGTGVSLVLQNLESLPVIDYHAESVLFVIAQRHAASVMAFFCRRIDRELTQQQEAGPAEFQAVPYDFDKLQEPLSHFPQQVVQLGREQFGRDRSLFQFLGGRLLKNIFPNFSADFERELLELVRAGGEANLAFVLAVLRNYEGQPFIHAVCREIIRSIPTDSKLRTEVAIALETTGVVSGEFGFVEAYERKRQEILEWLVDPDERVSDFARSYIEDLESMRESARKRAEEDVALRKHRFGESP
ncbi:hypothetical protein EI171_28895 [Bradyrhizobium sp. LCT2]|uniref:hypothetical protein n=1 Tax=Bradyrhizobium sp. LCT2 TaxID=2493093 RepID=UPI0013742BBB|nr:hypothetical protein [Bradyrhizobium sp. LCT2]QHP70955.1 hypothetical protein EI171_28895 [Bradyrhizobium sp. LCT2]